MVRWWGPNLGITSQPRKLEAVASRSRLRSSKARKLFAEQTGQSFAPWDSKRVGLLWRRLVDLELLSLGKLFL